MVIKHFLGKRTIFIILAAGTLFCSFLVMVGMLSLKIAVWVVLIVAGGIAVVESIGQRHYRKTHVLLRRLDELVKIAESSGSEVSEAPAQTIKYDPRGKTAILLVSGFNGLGLHTLFSVVRLFGSSFKNFIFLQVGVLDAHAIKDPIKVSQKTAEVNADLERYISYMQRHGYHAAGYPSCGTKIVDEIVRITPNVLEQYPNSVFFGGQLVFPNTSLLAKLFHNYTIFAIQKRFCFQGIPLVILPIRVC